MLRPTSLLALVLLAGACATPHEEDAAASEDALAVSKIEHACAPPIVAPDGRTAAVKVCIGSQEQVYEMDLTTGAPRHLGTASGPQKLAGFGAASGLTWFAIARPDGTWELTLKNGTTTRSVVPVFPAGAAAADTAAPSAFPYPDDNTVVTDRYFVSKASSSRYAVVVERTGTAPATVIDLGTAHNVLLPAPGGQHVLVAEGYGSSLDTTFRRLDLSGAAPSLGAAVTSTTPAVGTISGSYDGTSLVASTNGAVVVIDVTTGAATRVVQGLPRLNVIAVRGDNIWYSASRAGGYVIERVSRTGAPRMTLTTSPRLLDGTLSADGSTVLFRVGRIGEEMQLAKVAADGSQPAAVVWDGGGDLMRRDASGGHVSFLMRKGSGSFEWIVDDVTGEVVASYQQRSTEDAWHDPTLAADGTALYLSRACKVGAIDGQEIVRVGEREDVFVPCSYASTQPYRFTAIPNSGAVLSLTSEQQIVLLKP